MEQSQYKDNLLNSKEEANNNLDLQCLFKRSRSTNQLISSNSYNQIYEDCLLPDGGQQQFQETPIQKQADVLLERLIDSKIYYISQVEETVQKIECIRKELEQYLNNCKISNTCGNSLNIVGTALLLSPYFLVGMSSIAIGSATSIGTTVTRSFEEGRKLVEVKEALKKQGDMAQAYIDSIWNLKEFTNVSTKIGEGAIIVSSLRQAKTIQDVLQGFKIVQAVEPATMLTYNGVQGVKAVANLGSSASRTALYTAGVGALFAMADIVMTWTFDSQTLNKILELEEEQRLCLERETTELNKLII